MIFFIHNNQRPERVKNMNEQATYAGIDTFGIQPAIFLKQPKAGISEAHKAVVRKAKEQKWEFVIIMEDDIKFTHPDSFGLFMHFVMLAPKDIDILMAGLYTTNTFEPYSIPTLMKVSDVSGFHCYCVFEHAYDRFLEAPNSHHIDKWTTGKNLGKLNTVCVHPFLAIQQDDFYSDNKKQVKNYSHLLKKYKLYNG